MKNDTDHSITTEITSRDDKRVKRRSGVGIEQLILSEKRATCGAWLPLIEPQGQIKVHEDVGIHNELIQE